MTISVPNDHLIIPSHTSEYVHGAKQLIPGLEQALVGMHAGDKKRVELDADHAFGQYDANKKAIVPRTQLPQTIAAGGNLRNSRGATVHGPIFSGGFGGDRL
ncbi:MAG: FKBP-type peptidyl-prolyl cis-trans isomerase [Nitrospira sp.]|nr:FKBP-type peptidyl-prolyl cis-trans isomerase [Nitrospira sp.]